MYSTAIDMTNQKSAEFTRPVFVDHSGRRAVVARWCLTLTTVIVTVFVVAFLGAVTLAITPMGCAAAPQSSRSIGCLAMSAAPISAAARTGGN